jgi:hypothetical protein
LASGYGDTLNPYASKTANFVLAAPNGTAGVPTFRAIVAADIPTLNQNTTGTAAGLSATLAIASGGTGQTSANAALNALLPSQTSQSGKVLSTDGTNTTWTAVGGTGTVTSVALSAPAFLTVSGSPITASGTLALSYSGAALPVANGGTGQTTTTAAFDALAPSQTGNSGKYLTTNGTTTSWATVSGSGTVTSVAQSFTGGIVSVGGSPITSSGTLALTVAGTSGGVPYFSSGTTWASSAALTANALVIGGGAGVAPSTLGSTGTTTTVLHGNASGAPTFGAVSLSADVTGNLPVTNLNSGTSASSTTFWRGDGTWATPAGGGGGGPILESYQTISSNYSLTAGSNGFSVGPVSVATGVAVTVPTGQVWLIAA